MKYLRETTTNILIRCAYITHSTWLWFTIKPSILNPKYFQKFEVHPSVILRGGIQHSCLWYIYNYQSSLSFGWLLVLKHTFEALKIILQSPFNSDTSPRLCTMQSCIPFDTFFLKEYDICENVCSWWKESQVVLGEDGPHSPPWWGMQRVCLSRVLLLEEFWRGNHRWQLHLGELKSVPWAVTVHIVTRWSPSPSCKHLCKAAPTAHVAPYSGWHMGHDLPMLSAKSTIDQSSTEWWALTLMESSGGTFNMAVWPDGVLLLPNVLLQNCSF